MGLNHELEEYLILDGRLVMRNVAPPLNQKFSRNS